MQFKESPIGFFDSGVGGLTIWNQIFKRLPNESTIYLADSLNSPYGTKGVDEIQKLSIKNTELLLNYNVKLVVVACNTATTSAIHKLRSKFKIPFVGIEPAIIPASIASKTGKIGVLATKTTLSSSLFSKTSAKLSKNIELIVQEGIGLVDIVEDDKVHLVESKNKIKKLIQPMLDKNVDTIVLGCSHYPLLISVIKEILPKEISIIDSGLGVARQVENILNLKNLQSSGEEIKHLILSNKSTKLIKKIVSSITKDIIEINILKF